MTVGVIMCEWFRHLYDEVIQLHLGQLNIIHQLQVSETEFTRVAGSIVHYKYCIY